MLQGNEERRASRLPTFHIVSRMCLILTISGIGLIALALGEHISGGTSGPITTNLYYHLFWAGGSIIVAGFAGMITLRNQELPPPWMFGVVFILNAVTAVLSLVGLILCIVGLASNTPKEVTAYVVDSIECGVYLLSIGLTISMFHIAYKVKKQVDKENNQHGDTIDLVAA